MIAPLGNRGSPLAAALLLSLVLHVAAVWILGGELPERAVPQPALRFVLDLAPALPLAADTLAAPSAEAPPMPAPRPAPSPLFEPQPLAPQRPGKKPEPEAEASAPAPAFFPSPMLKPAPEAGAPPAVPLAPEAAPGEEPAQAQKGERREAPSSAAQALAEPAGPGADARAAYAGALFRLIDANKAYPEQALRRGEEGTVVLRLTIARDGSLLAVESAAPAPRRLVKAALDAVSRAAPFPPLPPPLAADEAVFEVPVVYRLE